MTPCRGVPVLFLAIRPKFQSPEKLVLSAVKLFSLLCVIRYLNALPNHVDQFERLPNIWLLLAVHLLPFFFAPPCPCGPVSDFFRLPLLNFPSDPIGRLLCSRCALVSDHVPRPPEGLRLHGLSELIKLERPSASRSAGVVNLRPSSPS